MTAIAKFISPNRAWRRVALYSFGLSMLAWASAAHAESVRSPKLQLELSGDGAIVSARWGGVERRLSGSTQMAGCTATGSTAMRKLGTGLEFERTLVCGEHRAHVIDRYIAAPEGVRWQVEIRGEGNPWSTPIETHLRYPATPEVRFWTAWADPSPVDKNWRDPLQTMPLSQRKLYYGAPPFDRRAHRGFVPSVTDLFAIPMATFSEDAHDVGLTAALALDDTMLDLTLDTAADGAIGFARLFHRIGAQSPVRFTLDLVPHEAGWRGGLRYMVGRYPEYFDSPNAKAGELAGTSAYASSDAKFDAAKMRAMAFRTNWMASFDFPYMGLFLPPVGDTERWVRFSGASNGEYKPEERGRNGEVTIQHLAEYVQRMRQLGFHVLNYFNVTEFGDHIVWPPKPAGAAKSPVDWRDPNQFLNAHFPGAVMRKPNGEAMFTWGGAVVMDPGEPAYQKHLLDQARLHLKKFPEADGFCIDRMDWLRLYNQNRDDHVSWFEDKPAQSLVLSWNEILGRLTREVHAAGKMVFCNNHTKRADLLRGIDGFFDEHTYFPPSLNTTGILAVHRPMLGWTVGEENLRPDPDAYFQRHLHLGAYPMAPFPGNDHSIAPGTWVDRQYLDYGPLLDAMRGKKWVLTPHAISVVGDKAKANLFETPLGYVVPVTFGGTSAEAVVEVRGIKAAHAEVLYPGTAEWVPLKIAGGAKGVQRIAVPLRRGCAMLRLQ
jgi:hypothetical protein